MANYLPQNSGLWSTTTWITAFSNLTAFAGDNIPPTIIDDVYADGKTITIDIDAGVRTLLTSTTPRTGGLAGGGFRINNAVSLSANLSAGTTTCLTFLSAAPNYCTVTGFVTGGGGVGLTNSSTGIMYINGGIYGGQVTSASTNGLVNSGTVYLTGFTIGGLATNVSGTVNNGTIVIYGFARGGTGAGNVYGLLNNRTATIYGYAIGAATGGGNQQNWGVGNQTSTSTITVYGSALGNALAGSSGIYNSSSGTVIVSGVVVGGSGGNAHGVNNVSTGTVIVSGNVIGGTGTSVYGINSSSNGSVIVFGNMIAGVGSGAYGAVNNATGYMEVNGIAIGNGWGLGSSGIGGAAPGIFGSQTGTTIIRGLSCGARGQWPTAGNVFIIPQNTSTTTFETSAFQDVTLFTSLSTNIVPPVSSVRQGTVYNLGDYRGTCSIPSISSVLQGVAVDNSVGIAALQPQTIWNYSTLSATDINSLGGRLKEIATVQSVGQQLTALN